MAKKYISEFVKKQQALQARSKKKIYLWFSPRGKNATYVKTKHGELI